MNELVYCKNNERKSVTNSNVTSLNSFKKVDPYWINTDLSNKSKNDKINVLKSLLNKKSQITKLRKELNLIDTKTSISEVPTNIDDWRVRLDPDSYYRLYKYIKTKKGKKACRIQVGRKFSVKKAKKKYPQSFNN